MLVKIIVVFLLAMVLLGMLGKLLFPNAKPRLSRRCPNCGRPMIGKTCGCGGKA